MAFFFCLPAVGFCFTSCVQLNDPSPLTTQVVPVTIFSLKRCMWLEISCSKAFQEGVENMNFYTTHSHQTAVGPSPASHSMQTAVAPWSPQSGEQGAC